MPSLKYKRVLLKLSGEALAGEQKTGIDPETVAAICGEIGTVLDMGVEMALVIGGGNIFRGLSGSAKGMERSSADYMGMLATVLNALNAKVRTLSARDNGAGIALTNVTLEVKNAGELKYIMGRLASIPGVTEVTRNGK